MSRRAARELVLHIIFQGEYSQADGDSLLESFINANSFESLKDEYELYAALPEKSQHEYIKTASCGVLAGRQELDNYIEKYAVGWNLNRISRVTKCILRLCMYEIKYMQIPIKASVNEALELAKGYDSEEAAQFVNGIMASFIRELQAGEAEPEHGDE